MELDKHTGLCENRQILTMTEGRVEDLTLMVLHLHHEEECGTRLWGRVARHPGFQDLNCSPSQHFSALDQFPRPGSAVQGSHEAKEDSIKKKKKVV